MEINRERLKNSMAAMNTTWAEEIPTISSFFLEMLVDSI